MASTLSIVIPSHNRPDLLRACLRTVCDHAPPGTQTLVVDDGSRGHAATRVSEEFAGVACLRLTRSQGFAIAANQGIARSAGEIVEILNDDTLVSPGWADQALKAFTQLEVGAVTPLVLRHADSGIAEDRIDSAGDRYYRGGVAAKRGNGRPVTESYLQAGRVFGASGSCAFYRREALLRVGGFPASFGAYFEDVDLAFRLHRAGYAVHYEPRSVVRHRVGSSYGRPGRRLLEQQSLNEERVFWRDLPLPHLLRALPSHAAVLAAKAWRRWQAGEFSPFAIGRLRMLGEVPSLIRHRQELDRLGSADDFATWQVETAYWG